VSLERDTESVALALRAKEGFMPNIVRAAIVQTEWTGDKDTMIKKNDT